MNWQILPDDDVLLMIPLIVFAIAGFALMFITNDAIWTVLAPIGLGVSLGTMPFRKVSETVKKDGKQE